MGYFKSLRQKIGVATLAIACVFAAGWLRSEMLSDILNLPYRSHRAGVRSQSGTFGWCYEYTLDGREYPTVVVGWRTETVPKPLIDWRKYQRGLGRLGFQWGSDKFGDVERKYYFQAPYWSIVIPLTLLSAYLLISKPRTKIGTTHV